jgi:hypothetical protein
MASFHSIEVVPSRQHTGRTFENGRRPLRMCCELAREVALHRKLTATSCTVAA